MKKGAHSCGKRLIVEYGVELKPSASRSIKNLPDNVQEQVFAEIKSLTRNPYPQGYKKKKGKGDLYGIPIGKYRVIYSVQPKTQLLLILWAGHHQADFHRPKFWNSLRRSL